MVAGEAPARWPHLEHPCPQRHTLVWKSYPIRVADVTCLPRVVYTERPTGAETDTARAIDGGTTYATGRKSGTDHRRCCRCRRTTHGIWRGGSTPLRPRRGQGGVDR